MGQPMPPAATPESAGFTRRDFLRLSGTGLGGAAWAAWRLPAVQTIALAACRAAEEGAPLEVLSTPQAREIAAIAEQIFPSDETPGAREAHVLHFIDRALGSFAAGARETIEAGLAGLRETVGRRHPGETSLAGLDFDAQTAILREIEDGELFATVHLLTVMGMFANPEYGGNADRVGWRLLGFEPRAAWRPPFGHYDAEGVAGPEEPGP